MKTILTLFLLIVTFFNHATAQKTCLNMMSEGNKSLKSGNYRSAILKFQAAAKCDVKLSQSADEKILIVFDKIESLKRNAENEKKVSEDNIKKLSTLIADVTGLLQRDENSSIIGLDNLKNDIFQIILPYYDFIKNRSSDVNNDWKVAKSHLQIGFSLESLGEAGFEEEYQKAYEISYASLKKLTDKGVAIPEDLIITVIDATVYHSWTLMNQNLLQSAENILLNTNSLIAEPDEKSVKIVYAHSKLANALSRYYQDINEQKKAYLFSKATIGHIELATSLDKDNLKYKASQAVYLRNLNVKQDTFHTEEDKRLIEKGCVVATELRDTPGSGTLALTTLSQCIHNESFDLTREEKYEEAIALVEQGIEQLDFYIHLEPVNTSYYLHRARFYSRLASIYLSLKDEKLRLESLLKAKDNWALAINDKTSVPDELWIVRNVYIDIRELHDLTTDSTQKIQILRDLEGAIKNSANKNKNVYDIALIAGDIHSNLGEFLKKNNYDYDMVLEYFNKAVNYYSNTNILLNIDHFTEKYSWYCNAIRRRLVLNTENKRVELVLNDLNLIDKLFTPVLEKYPFDFYTRQHFWSGYKSAGNLLFEEKRYQEAKPLLEYGSKWGIKESSTYLAQIYREGLTGEINTVVADSLDHLASKQSMKKFTIPCQFGKKKAPFDVYVIEFPKDFQYKGIDDQRDWLVHARGGHMPDEVSESFIKLQNLAWKNDVSYPDLCVYALEAANEEKRNTSKEELDALLSSGSLTRDQKIMKYDEYFEFYRNKVKKDSTNKSHIKNYLNAGYNFVNYLIEIRELNKARSITKELIQSNPEEAEPYRTFARVQLAEYEDLNNENPSIDHKKVLTSRQNSAIGVYYRYFLKKKDRQAALFWQSKIQENNKYSSIKFVLFKYQLEYQLDLFKELYLIYDVGTIKEDISYFVKEISNEKSNENKKNYYKYLIRLEKYLLEVSPNEDIDQSLGSHYNSLAWYQLLTGEFKLAEESVILGLKIDPDNLYFHSNLPAAFLLQGKYKKARKLYKKWKDKPFDPDAGYPTFKDAFLDDFKTFKKEEVIPEKYKNDVEKIISLLNN